MRKAGPRGIRAREKEGALTKRELVIELATKLGYTQNEVSAVVQTLLDTIVAVLAEGQRLEIRNFGVFETRTREARIGRNPRTGEEVPISEKRVPTFKPGKVLKQWVQGGPGQELSGMFEGDGNVEEGPSSAPHAARLGDSSGQSSSSGGQQPLF